MRGEGEDLPITGSEAVEDLEPEFTYNELLEEISKYFVEARQPGDVDARQIAARHKVTVNCALDRMEKIARENPSYLYLMVKDGTRPPIRVLRKISR